MDARNVEEHRVQSFEILRRLSCFVLSELSCMTSFSHEKLETFNVTSR